MYDPPTISKTPNTPIVEGYSPTINGEVKSKNMGVNVIIGIVTDRSDTRIARMYSTRLTALSRPPARIAFQNVAFSSGMPTYKRMGRRIGNANADIDQEIKNSLS